jgi:hypothetical protein
MLVDNHRGDLVKSRTVAIAAKEPPAGAADFFVLFSPAQKVEGVSFISGAEPLRALSDSLRSAPYERMFPDENAAKLLRRGTLTCEHGKGCTFTLLLPDDTRPAK